MLNSYATSFLSGVLPYWDDGFRLVARWLTHRCVIGFILAVNVMTGFISFYWLNSCFYLSNVIIILR
jgi:hypothetical protein